MSEKLFDKLGGFSQIRKIISEFYDKLLDNENLSHYFKDVDMAKLIDHQTKFITYVLDGPVDFKEEALKRAHSSLGISTDEFDEMAGLLRETLEDFDLEPSDIEIICSEVEKRRPVVII